MEKNVSKRKDYVLTVERETLSKRGFEGLQLAKIVQSHTEYKGAIESSLAA